MSLIKFEEGLRTRSYRYAHVIEAILHTVLALLLATGAGAALLTACLAMWRGLTQNMEELLIIDQLLLVLIYVEILHTVRISIRSESLLMEPFLIVGVIASVRRVLVITMQAAHAMKDGPIDERAAVVFRNSMIELGLLGLLVLVFVISIYFLRRRPPLTEEKLAK